MSFRTIDNFTNIYITADLHLSKEKIPKPLYFRGFDKMQDHNNAIRNNINRVAKSKNDILIINGDLGYENDIDSLLIFIESLTPKVYVVKGNHDNFKNLLTLKKSGVIKYLGEDLKIRWNNNLFHIHHLPLLEWEGYYQGAFHCFGHCHGKIQPYLRAMDVGLDANNMKILNLQDIIEKRNRFQNY